MGVRSRDSERGQVLLIMAMGFFLVMLAASALAIDIGNGTLQKRRLQNTADAAALAAATQLSQGGTVDDAVAAAQGIVSDNTGGAVTLPYNPAVTLGASLQDGIEFDGKTVRVALGRSVSTYFAPAFGVNHINVAAKARATVGPGILPITFKRFASGNTAYRLDPPDNPDTTTDLLMPAQDASGNPITIDDWPIPLTLPPSPAASDTADGHYDPTVSGKVAPLIGHDAVANVANGNDFHFFVAPDVRGFSQLTPTYYNGADISTTQSAQLLKDTTIGYILAGGYPGPSLPAPGDELAAFSGVTNNGAVKAMQQRYKPGDLVTTMVYNGTVYRKPSFTLAVNPSLAASTNTPPTTLSVQVTLVPVYNFTNAGVVFSASGLSGWGDWQFSDGTTTGGANADFTEPITGTNPVTLTFTVKADQPGAKTALIEAYAPPPVGSAEGQTRTICATFVVGTTPSFSVASGEAFKVVQQGSGTRFDLDVQGWNGISNEDAPVSWQWLTAPTGTVTISTPSTVQVRDGHTTGLRVNVDVGADASLGEYPLLLTIKDADPNHQERNQTMILTLEIASSTTSNTVLLNTSFVKVLGYANFRIDYFTNNTVYAHAVSGLITLDQLIEGLAPRLIPWN